MKEITENMNINNLYQIEQLLSVNLKIPVPPDSIIITKVQLEELNKQNLRGLYWTMNDLEKRVNRKREWIIKNILYPSKFQKILDVEFGGFVFYPKTKGQTWSFHALKMTEFLDNNFENIFNK